MTTSPGYIWSDYFSQKADSYSANVFYTSKSKTNFREHRVKEGVKQTKKRRWWRGKLSLACSISACLNWPVKSSRLEQMQIALTCLHQKKKKSWRLFKWTHSHNGGEPRAGWIYGLGSEWHNVWEPNRGAVKWSEGSGPSRLLCLCWAEPRLLPQH